MLVRTHNYSAKYRAEHSLSDSARAEVHSVPGGFVFRTLDVTEAHGDVWQNAAGVPFDTVDEALSLAVQFVEYPDVAEYLDPLDLGVAS